MSRKAKGKRPIYFNNPESDRLMAIMMAVAGELSVLRERLDTVERLTVAKNVFSLSEIEQYRPDEKVAAEREKWRVEYLDRILRIVHHERESAETGETPESYVKVVEIVSSS